MNTLSVPFKKLRRIIHLADIHVKLFKRHEDYEQAFDQLYHELRLTDLTETVIVVAGDIVHSKTDMSPELVQLVSHFLQNLSDIAPTIIIPGNHDLNLQNKNRLDALSPIINNIKHPNLHYLLDSGVYRVADVDFVVHSILDEKEEWPLVTESTAATKIALYHGPLYNAETDIGYIVTSRHVDVETFDGYDMVLLGDIHKHQVLQQYDAVTNKPIIVYPGSLIQQNHGEELDGHGWCDWDVQKKEYTFHELDTGYGYYTITIKDGVVPDYSEMPKNVYLRMFAGDMPETDIKNLIATIRKDYNIQAQSVNKFNGIKGSNANISAKQLLDIYDVNYQNKLIAEYIHEAMPSVSDEIIDEILKLNILKNTEISADDIARKVVWTPIYLKFDNLFTYGESNFIDFRKLNGVVGIFSPNRTGKTSIAEAICFALYDRTPRASKASNIMNERRDTSYCELRFEINGEEFVIERKGTKNKKREVKMDVNFYKINPDGTQKSLNGEERRYTNHNIRSYVGDYEDFILTAFSSSTKDGMFVDRGQSDRKDVLSQFMGLNIFDKLDSVVENEAKEIAMAMKQFKNDDFTQELVDLDIHIDNCNTIIDRDQIKADALTTTIEYLTIEINQNYEQKIPIDSRIANVNEIVLGEMKIDSLKQKEILTERIIGYQKSIGQERSDYEGEQDGVRIKLTALEELLDRANDRMATYTDIEEEYETYKNISIEQIPIKNAIETTKNIIASKQKSLTRLAEHKYDPNCTFCVTNGHATITETQETEQEIVEAQAKLLSLGMKLTELEKYQETNKWVQEKYQKYKTGLEFVRTKEKEISDIKLDMERAQNRFTKTQHEIQNRIHTAGLDIVKYDDKIKEIDLSIVEYHKQLTNIKHNKQIDEEIAKLTTQQSTTKTDLKWVTSQIGQSKLNLSVAQRKKDEILKKITEAKAREQKHQIYSVYRTVISRDGLPYKLIASVLPDVQMAVNNILSQAVEFSMIFEMDGKNVNMRLSYDEDQTWALEMASGMEKFISGLAIRVGLTSVSSLPKSNFLILDEGLGVLDPTYRSSLPPLFDILRTQFDFIFLISHVDEVRDMADMFLDIKRDNDFSYIKTA